MYFIGNLITGTESKGSCKSQAGGGGLTCLHYTQRSALALRPSFWLMHAYVFRLKSHRRWHSFGRVQPDSLRPVDGVGFQHLKISRLYLKQSGFLVLWKKENNTGSTVEWGLLAGAQNLSFYPGLLYSLMWASVPVGTGITSALEKEK